MPQPHCLLAIDQGTTSSRAIVFKAEDMQILAVAQREFTQHYPHAGWVEHDPQEIWSTTLEVLRDASRKAEQAGYAVAAVGITNQRETSIVWDRETGEAIHRAIVWQDRRTTERCEALRGEGAEEQVTASTGLLLDPYFSATKVAWILDHVEGARARAERGELAFGTVDSFLLYHLTGGQVHATDVTNASRTSLFDIHQMAWSDELCRLFAVPPAVLPEVHPCLHHFGDLAPQLLGRAIPVFGIAGDQQAAAIGQACFTRGSSKCTYGTGCFALVNTGSEAITSRNRLLTTVAYQIDGQLAYALEGSIFVAGAAIQWLRDELGMLSHASESQALAASLSDNDGVYLVPAFTGLGAPYWTPTARGAIVGLTRGSTRAHFARAALEAVCYQTQDLLTAMVQDGITPSGLRVDGGMVANDWLLQFLADTIDLPVERPANLESTALGAAYLAGRGAGLCGDFEAFQGGGGELQRFEPCADAADRERRLGGWARAVASVLP